MTASDIFARQKKNGKVFAKMDKQVIMDSLSRSYEHQGDSIYIPRYSSSASMVIHGVKAGESPENIVLWTALGNPSVTVTVPVLVSEDDHIPAMLKKGKKGDNSLLCDLSLNIKKSIYPQGKEGKVALDKAKRMSEFFSGLDIPFRTQFDALHDSFINGKISYRKYMNTYDKLMKVHLETVKTEMEKVSVL